MSYSLRNLSLKWVADFDSSAFVAPFRTDILGSKAKLKSLTTFVAKATSTGPQSTSKVTRNFHLRDAMLLASLVEAREQVELAITLSSFVPATLEKLHARIFKKAFQNLLGRMPGWPDNRNPASHQEFMKRINLHERSGKELRIRLRALPRIRKHLTAKDDAIIAIQLKALEEGKDPIECICDELQIRDARTAKKRLRRANQNVNLQFEIMRMKAQGVRWRRAA